MTLNFKPLVVNDAAVYRKEQWGVPLAAALLELRECAHQQRQPKVNPPPPRPHATPRQK